MKHYPAAWHRGPKLFRVHERHVMHCPACDEWCAFKQSAFGWYVTARGCAEDCPKTDDELAAAFALTAGFARIA